MYVSFPMAISKTPAHLVMHHCGTVLYPQYSSFHGSFFSLSSPLPHAMKRYQVFKGHGAKEAAERRSELQRAAVQRWVSALSTQEHSV